MWKYLKASLSKKYFWKKIFALLKTVYQDVVETFFKKSAPEVNANFYVLKANVQRLRIYQSSKG